MLHYSSTLITLLLSSIVCPLLASADTLQVDRGKAIQQADNNGVHYVYIPEENPSRTLVVAHGTPSLGESTNDLAKNFIQRWVRFANRNKLLLIAPSFDRENFGSDPGTGFGYGGYRGLFGREQGADDFVLSLTRRYSPLCDIQDGRFLLYGHSAGAQFAIRFVVKHPDKIAAAVASAPGRFAYPAADAAWPYGMGTFNRTIKWSDTESIPTHYRPAKRNWERAARLPLAIVYGEQDTEPQPERPAHAGSTRIDYGTAWVAAMNALTADDSANIRLLLVPGVGHDSARLTPASQKQFKRLTWVEPTPLEQYRTWKSKLGNFSVEAIYVGQSRNTIRLKKRDSSMIEVDIEKLSDEDAEIVRSGS